MLWRGIGVDYEGGVLDGASRIAIQLAHRMMAVVVFVYLLWLALQAAAHAGHARLGARCWRCCRWRRSRSASPTSSSALPLSVAVLHNAGAALLLFVLVSLLARLRTPEP